MAVISQTGVFAFGLQPEAGVMASTFYRHKANDIDLGVMDDTRLGPTEIGGIPTPTFGYKAGVMVSGGATINPRLENSIGVILKAVLGTDNFSTGSFLFDGAVLPPVVLKGTTTEISFGLAQPPVPTKLKIVASNPDASANPIAGNVTIYGIDNTDSAINETVDLSSDDETVALFKTVTKVILPAKTNPSGDTISIGYEVASAKRHVFTFNPTNKAFVPWVTLRKLIPGSDIAQPIGETYVDCKLLSAAMTLSNDGLVTTRLDALGKFFSIEENPSWTYANTYETDESLLISSVIGSGLTVPGFSSIPLPVVNATLTFTNAPLDVRQEKVFGSPFLEDITITSRSVTIDAVVKWRDPDLYRTIVTGSKAGITWSPKPFTAPFKIKMISSGVHGTGIPYALAIEAPKVLFMMNGGIVLAGAEMVAMRVTGVVLDDGSNDYVKVTLINDRATAY